jgi:DNA-binding MarR family transcriptional regulator
MSGRWVAQTSHERLVLDVLREIRAFTDAIDRMHGALKGDMDMNATDLAAMRMLIIREQRGESVSPHDLARHLRISTASTSKLLDRLVVSGHVQRMPHPRDRRAVVVALTDKSREDFFRHFGERLSTMRGVAERYDEEELGTIARFLADLSEAIRDEPVREL